MPIERHVAVITGGASGIGLSIVRHAADAGMAVVAIDWHQDAIRAARSQFRSRAKRVIFVHGDVGTPEGAALAIGTAIERFRRVDLLCNNAAVHPIEPIDRHELRSWRETFRVNVDGTMLCSQAVLPHMKRQRRGAIINMGSISGITPYAGGGAYAASKAAIVSLTKVLALESGRWGIRVNCITSGSIMHRRNAVGKAKPQHIPIGRNGTPEDVSELVLFLASDAATYITGTEIILDGGAMAGREKRSSR